MKIFMPWHGTVCGVMLAMVTLWGAETEEIDPAVTAPPDAPAEADPVPAIPPPPVIEASNAVAALEAAIITNAPPPEPSISAEQAWKSFLQLQGQMDTALLAIERSRREREIVEEQNQRHLEQRLKMIEQSIDHQRSQEAQAMREANHNLLLVAGLFAGIGFLAMVLTSFFHFRAMNKLSGVIAHLPMDPGFGPGSAALSAREERLLAAQSNGEHKGTRLLSAIERLEQRIGELEVTSQVSQMPGSGAALSGNGHTPHAPAQGASEAFEWDAKMTVTLGKGQALLNLGQAAEALACFEEVLVAQPKNAEAWLKKGTALEKLNRLSEAIDCYDQAIAHNDAMTLAYLYKGGVFNRLERYNEALACYERALQTQKPTVPSSAVEVAD